MDNKDEFLKTVYEQASEHHRVYILWREKMLAGFVVIIGALIVALSKLNESETLQQYFFLVFLSGFLISFVFLRFERRNSELFIDCQNVAKKIEMDFGLDSETETNKNNSLFHTLDNSSFLWRKFTGKKNHKYHGVIFDRIYLLAMALSFIGMVLSLGIFNFCWFNGWGETKIVKISFEILMAGVSIWLLYSLYWAIFKFKRIKREDIENRSKRKEKDIEELMQAIRQITPVELQNGQVHSDIEKRIRRLSES